MLLKSSGLTLALLLSLTHALAQTPGKIKVSRSNGAKADSTNLAKQSKRSMFDPGNFPRLQPSGGDIGVVYKSPESIGFCLGITGALFAFGKEKDNAIGLLGGVNVFYTNKKFSVAAGELGFWYWRPSFKKLFLTLTALRTKDSENDIEFYSFKPGIRYALTRRFSFMGGIQIDTKPGTASLSPQVVASLQYRIRLGGLD